MPVFIYGSIVLNLLTWYNLIFRGTALAQKTQVMFFGFWWKNVFSAVRPGKSATRRGWITWCSYLWPWRQQPTRVMVPKWETSGLLSHTWKPTNWREGIQFSHCQVASGVDPAQMVSGWHVSFPRFLSPHVIFLWEESNASQVFVGGITDRTYFSAYKFDQPVGLESA